VPIAGLVAMPARAGPVASAHLVYVKGPGADGCPGEQALRAAVATRLGYDPFFAWAHDTLFVEITRTEATFRVEIKLVADDNTRRGARELAVKGDDCSTVIDAIGLSASLTIDPSSIMGTPQAASPAPPGTGPPAPPERGEPTVEEHPMAILPSAPAPSVESPPTLSRPKPLAGYVGAGAAGSLGTAPSAALGATLLAGLRWRSFSLDGEGRADLPATGNANGGTTLTSWRFVAAAVPCGHLGFAFGCAIASGGALGATSTARLPATAYAPWWSAGVRAGVELPLTPSLSWRAYAELMALLAPTTLTIDGRTAYPFKPLSESVGVVLVRHVR
jgi:hypothetical protein